MDLIVLGLLVLGLTEVFKKAFGITSRYIPLVALATTFGLIALYSIATWDLPDWKLIQDGFIIALTSVGLYSSVKNSRGK